MSFYIITNLLLAFAWAAFWGNFSPQNLLVGFVLGYLVLFISRRALPPSRYFEKVPTAIRFFFFFIWELLIASVKVAAYVVSPKSTIRPRVLAYKMEASSPAEIVLLSNLITLTPGSISLDISSDHTVLYIHAMNANDEQAAIDEFRRLEVRILQLMR